ncbi:MAG: site-specific integrase [Bacteroidales bacterium]
MKSPIKLRKKKLSDGRESLYLDIYQNGVRRYEFLKLYLLPEGARNAKKENKSTLEYAQQICTIRTAQLAQGLLFEETNDYSKMLYVDYLRADSRSMFNTISYTLYPIFEKVEMGNIKSEWIEQVRQYIVSLDHLKPNTQAIYYHTFILSLKIAVDRKIIAPLSFSLANKLPRIETERNFLSEDEIRRFWQTECRFTRDVREAFIFACMTGLRISDIAQLTWEMIDTDNCINIRMRKTGVYIKIPINNFAAHILDIQRKTRGDQTRVFQLYTSNHMINSALEKISKASGIDKKITFHVARHTFATLSISKSVDIYTVSKLLGHKNVATTGIYAKVLDEAKKEATDKISIDFDLSKKNST